MKKCERCTTEVPRGKRRSPCDQCARNVCFDCCTRTSGGRSGGRKSATCHDCGSGGVPAIAPPLAKSQGWKPDATGIRREAPRVWSAAIPARIGLGHVYDYNGSPARVRFRHKFQTPEGGLVAIEDPHTGASLGNAPGHALGLELNE